MTASEVASLTGAPVSAAVRFARAANLKLGKGYQFTQSDLEMFIEWMKRQQPAPLTSDKPRGWVVMKDGSVQRSR